jgi:hypothetical protein
MNRDEVRFITLNYYNTLADTSYENITELLFNPPSFKDELALRDKLGTSPYDLSIILVVEKIPDKKIEILCKAKTYSDVKEVLIKL